MVELGEVALFQIESGGTPKTDQEKYWNGNINWATLVDLPAKDFITNLNQTKKKITNEGLTKSSAKLLPKKSILISSRATIGRIAVNHEETATNQGFKNIIIKDHSRVNVFFVALMIKNLVPKLEQLGEGSTYKEFSKSDLASIKIPLPPLETQEQIVAEIEEEQKAITECKNLITTMQKKITTKINEVWNT